ncbi:MAG: phosphate ABC transporter permease subunit PstC [candidate division Zixibacteria bacterium RBG_16_50_21]|nr:MAG: phosphate ABC transporter permease subunit PstC [candidate division Zixibacteria bacterium RBG_16_50_21]
MLPTARIKSGDSSVTIRVASIVKRFRFKEFLIEKFILVNSFAAIIGVILIFLFIFRESLPLFTDSEIQQEASLDKFVTQKEWQPVSDNPRYAFFPLLVGTLKAVGVASLFAIPLSILAAIYTTEFAPRRLREFFKPGVEMLAGIPSVVLGFFALIVMATFLQNMFGYSFRLNAFNAGIALGLAIIPTIYSVSEDALNAVPRALREASLALGASSWQTAYRIVLSVALPGVLAGVILGVARAIGETMIVLMASGNAALVSGSIFDSIRTFSATIAAELAEVVFGSAHYHTLFFIGSVLFAITLLFNILAHLAVGRLQKRLAGK